MTLLTIPKVLEILNGEMPISEYTLRKGFRSGRFPYVKMGGRYLVDPDAVREAARNEMQDNQRKAASECSAQTR